MNTCHPFFVICVIDSIGDKFVNEIGTATVYSQKLNGWRRFRHQHVNILLYPSVAVSCMCIHANTLVQKHATSPAMQACMTESIAGSWIENKRMFKVRCFVHHTPHLICIGTHSCVCYSQIDRLQCTYLCAYCTPSRACVIQPYESTSPTGSPCEQLLMKTRYTLLRRGCCRTTLNKHQLYHQHNSLNIRHCQSQ